ncbi:MAG: diacylglycerol/lipid kinase family protein [Anaerolineae bacterium]
MSKTLYAKLIANTGAGQVKKDADLVGKVARRLMDGGLHVDVALSHPIKNARRAAEKAVKDRYDIIIGMGGDGTIGAVIRGMVGSKARLGVIAAGTENDFAHSLGIPDDTMAACDLILAGKTRSVDLGRLRTKETKRFDFFMVTAIGVIATVYPMLKNVPEGDYSGLKDALKTFFNFETTPKVYLTMDDQAEVEFETMLVTITNTPLIGLNNLVAPDASMEDGLLDVAVYPGFSKADLIAYFARTAKENSAADDNVQRFRVKKLKVRSEPKLDIGAEGILMGNGKAWIKALPGAIRVLAPEPGTGTEKPVEETVAKAPEKAVAV